MQEKLIKIMKEALETDIVNLDDHLNSFDNWDSLTRLSIIALIDEYFEVQISDIEFNEFKTIRDILNSLNNKL